MANKKIKVAAEGARRIRLKGSTMPRVEPEMVARALGAEVIESGQQLRGSPIALYAVRKELEDRLRSSGGRPSLLGTTRRQKIPLGEDDWSKLQRLAEKLSEAGTSASPGQVASVLLHRILEDVDEYDRAFDTFAQDEIAAEVDRFPKEYHEGFAVVRGLAQRYFRGEDVVRQLAEQLHRVLVEWKAGQRGAPRPRPADVIARELLDPHVRTALHRAAGVGVQSLSSRLGSSQLEEKRVWLLQGLHIASERFLEDNDSITYPTKALLLLGGAIIALDSKVREALKSLGFPGFAATQYPLPSSTNDRGFEKFFDVLVRLGDYWLAHETQIRQAIEQTSEARILSKLDSPGRVFDILLFMGGRCLRGVSFFSLTG